MEGTLAQAITTDAELIAMDGFVGRDPETWFFASSSVGIGPDVPPPERPYIVWNELPSTPWREVSETSNSEQRAFTIYVYDYKGDFTRINAILRVLRRIVKNLAPFVGENGERCSESRWGGMSGNITDDGYDSCARFATARFTVSD